MDHPSYDRRGLFDGLRVPFDPNMLILALICVAGFHWIVLFLEWFMGTDHLLLRFVTGLGVQLHPEPGGGLSPAQWCATVLLALGFWAFFSTAINRVSAMRLAREETISLKDALDFATRKFIPVLGTAGFVGAVYAILYFGVNGTVFGWLGRIPFLGELLIALFYPLILLFTFLLVFAFVLALFGFNLASSAIATESSDTWDGISRAWNYILVRPWTVILVLGLTISYITVFAFAGSRFMTWSIDSLAVGGSWGMGDQTILVRHEGDELEGDLKRRVYGPEPLSAEIGNDPKVAEAWKKKSAALDEKDFWVAIPGKVEFLRGFSSGRYSWSRVEYQVGAGDLEALDARYGDDGFDQGEAPDQLANLGFAGHGSNNVAFLIDPTLKFAAVVIWLFRWLCIYLMAAYALQYLLSANTMLYFLLRKSVEGEDYGEIVVDEEEFDEEAAWNITIPETPPSKGAPGQLLMPASSVGGPPAKLPEAPTSADAKPKDGKPQDAKSKDAKSKDAKPKDGKPKDAKDGKSKDAKDGKSKDANADDAKPRSDG